MIKMFQWVMAATLICGASVFTSCSKDDSSNEPKQEQTGTERDKFIEHTRAQVKYLAENLNFTSWVTANSYDLYFNKYVLNNPEFETSILSAFAMEALNTMKPVEEGSELAANGFQYYATVDMTNFNYRFTMKDDNSGFDVEPADNFEVIINGMNPRTEQLEKGLYKVTMKTLGTTMTRVLPMPKVDGTAMVIVLGSEFQFAISSKISGSWNDDFTGTMHYQVPAGATDASLGFTADAVIKSNILAGTVGDKSDNTQLELSISSDRVNGHATGQLSWTQNGRKIVELSIKESGDNLGAFSKIDFKQFESGVSIFEVFASILGSRSIDEAKLTLLDDLTTTFSISNLQKLIEIEDKYRTDGRNYADKETIDAYTKEMNDLVKAEMYCKGTNQTLPMYLLTAPVGIDYWTVYGFKFSDEDEYVSLLSLLDRKTFAYMLNIMDHSVDHVQQSVIVGRQLIYYIMSLNEMFEDSDSSPVEN